MRNKYPFFKYVTGESKMHMMNSKMKIIWLLIMMLEILLINDYISLLLVLVEMLFIMENTKISVSAYISNLLTIWPLYAVIPIVITLITFKPLIAILWGLKFVFLVLLFVILTFTTSLSEIAWGFECLFEKAKKIKIPVSKISLKIAMNIKFISTLFEESKQIRKSMAYRGVPYNKNGLKSFRRMVIPVLSLSYRLSRRMGKAMKLRFYGSSKKRTNYHENKVTNFDKIIIAIPIILMYIVIWLGWC